MPVNGLPALWVRDRHQPAVFPRPGLNNWDTAVEKDTRLTEGTSLEFRAEFFNAFNHAQFILNYADYADPANFGYVRSANAPRIIQLGVKLLFRLN